MLRRSSLRMVVLLLAGLGTVTHANAKSCEQPSPNLLLKGEEQYFSLEDTSGNSEQYRQLIAKVYERAQGKWTGSYNLTDCENPEIDLTNSLHQQHKNTRVNVQISVDSSGAVNMGAELYSPDRKSTSLMAVYLFTGLLSDVKVVGNGQVHYTEKYRPKLKTSRGSVLRESIGQLAVTADSYVLTVSNYGNGYFVSEETWTLKPSK